MGESGADGADGLCSTKLDVVLVLLLLLKVKNETGSLSVVIGTPCLSKIVLIKELCS